MFVLTVSSVLVETSYTHSAATLHAIYSMMLQETMIMYYFHSDSVYIIAIGKMIRSTSVPSYIDSHIYTLVDMHEHTSAGCVF